MNNIKKNLHFTHFSFAISQIKTIYDEEDKLNITDMC